MDKILSSLKWTNTEKTWGSTVGALFWAGACPVGTGRDAVEFVDGGARLAAILLVNGFLLLAETEVGGVFFGGAPAPEALFIERLEPALCWGVTRATPAVFTACGWRKSAVVLSLFSFGSS
jgi:hypothetical protein